MLLADVLTCFAKSSCADAESFSASTLWQPVFGFVIQVSWSGGQLCFGRDRFGAAG
jgi:hypothetical protein